MGTRLLGGKLALFIGADLLVIRRDNKPSIPWPNHLDLPGGGAEPGEGPEECVLRETQEEVGLVLLRQQLTWSRAYEKREGLVWFFAAHLPPGAEAGIVFGDEGQGWELMSPGVFVEHPEAVPQFKDRVSEYLRERTHV